MIQFPLLFIFTTFLSAILVFLIKKTNLFSTSKRRQGGLIVALVSLLIISLIYFFHNTFGILAKDYWSIVTAGLIIIVGGFLDDKFDLSPIWQLSYQALAVLVLLLARDTINHVQIPIWGIVHFPFWINYTLSFLWIVVLINSINWFDGLDGLAGGVGLIGMVILFFLSLTPLVSQPQTAVIALTIAGALLGFLFFNFPPASVYLGSVGSNFVGLMLALLSVYLGGKVATAALILGIPLLDFIYVLFLRVKNKQFPWKGGDRRHLHYQLVDLGMSKRRVVILMYVLSASFGITALTLQTGLKITFLAGLVLVFFGLIFWLKKTKEKQGLANK